MAALGFGNVSGFLSRPGARKQIIGIVPIVIDRKHELAMLVDASTMRYWPLPT
jgi:hypothetical protein